MKNKITEKQEFDDYSVSNTEWVELKEPVEFSGLDQLGLANAGTLIMYTDGYVRLIGDILKDGGLCDHCVEYDRLIIKYKVILEAKQ